MAAKAAIEAMGGKGNLVHLTGNKVDSNTQCRIVGVQKAVDGAGGKVILVQTITDIDLQSAQKAVADLLAARGKDVQGIVTTAYNPAVAAAAGVKRAGRWRSPRWTRPVGPQLPGRRPPPRHHSGWGQETDPVVQQRDRLAPLLGRGPRHRRAEKVVAGGDRGVKIKIGKPCPAEDGNGCGRASLEQTISRNVAVTVWDSLARWGVVRDRSEDAVLARYVDRLGIRLSGPRQLACQLSGGNQEKVSLAKWLAADCAVLIIDEPTVGIDVRTKAAFHELIAELAEGGLAILLMSSDLPEVVTLADRIAVMRDHQLVGEVDNDHHYATMSGQVIRLVHGETHETLEPGTGVPRSGVPAA